MTRIDVHSALMLARQRDAELRSEAAARRLAAGSRSLAHGAMTSPQAAPIMHAWLRLAAGDRSRA